MRTLPFVLALALAGCNPGIAPPHDNRNEAAPVPNRSAPAEQSPAEATKAITNSAEAPAAPETEAPSVAEMSPYRRREYERGWRDCMTGNFDRERQGESYRIGCMAAEDAKQRRSGR